MKQQSKGYRKEGGLTIAFLVASVGRIRVKSESSSLYLDEHFFFLLLLSFRKIVAAIFKKFYAAVVIML